MSDIEIDIPDITVVVSTGEQYVSNITYPNTVQTTDTNYYTAADTAVNAVSASYALTASYALNAQGTGFPFTGSAKISGSLLVTGGTISGSFSGDGSGLTGVSATSLSGGTAGYIPLWNTSTTLSSSAIYETSSSIVVSKPVAINGDLTVDGTITADKLVVANVVSSSIIYESGSTKFGDTLDDTHQFTGSLQVNGSITGSLLGTSSLAQTAITSSYAGYAVSASYIDGGYY